MPISGEKLREKVQMYLDMNDDMTLRKLAIKSGVSAALLSEFLSGKRKGVSTQSTIKLLKVVDPNRELETLTIKLVIRLRRQFYSYNEIAQIGARMRSLAEMPGAIAVNTPEQR